MKVLLRKILEKLVLVVLCLVLIIGNILLIYNIKNKFSDINEMFNIREIIDNAQYISIKDVENNKTVIIDDDEKKVILKKLFSEIKIRESKLELMDRNQQIDYAIFIINYEGEESYINFTDREIMIYDKIYESDFKTKSYFEEIFY